MIATVLTVFGVEQSVTTAVNFNGAKLLRVYNAESTDATVTLTDAENVTVASFTVPAKETVFLSKNPTEKIACSGACKVVPVGF